MNLARTVRVGSRSSPLALAQTEEVLSLLRGGCADVEFEAVHLSTRGDRNANAALTSLGRGAFVKDIELALLDGEIDFAVHSAKDVGPDIPDGLRILPVGERQDARDVLVSKSGLSLMGLPAGNTSGNGEPAPEGSDQGAPARCRGVAHTRQRGNETGKGAGRGL